MKKLTILLAFCAAFTMLVFLTSCGSDAESTRTSKTGEERAGEPAQIDEELDEPESEQELASLGMPTQLHVEGAQLVDAGGKAVQLKGISTHGLSWFPQYVNADLFRELADEWGASVVRLALYTAESGGYCTDGNREQLKRLVLDGVQYATDAHLYVIVDWHTLSDSNPLEHADEAEKFFDEMSQTLSDHTNVLYEICNEPNGSTTWEDVKSYAERIIPVIRANDPDSVIIVGTPEWSQRVDLATEDPLEFDNVMYALHFYAATHKDDLRNRMREAVKSGVPVFVSEFGTCDASGDGAMDLDSAAQWVEDMDELGVSYVMWNLSNKDESSSTIAAGNQKVSGFTSEDLSASGQWLRALLSGQAS